MRDHGSPERGSQGTDLASSPGEENAGEHVHENQEMQPRHRSGKQPGGGGNDGRPWKISEGAKPRISQAAWR